MLSRQPGSTKNKAMNVKGFYTGLAGIIAREEREEKDAIELSDKLVAIWEIESPKYSEHWRQRGEPIASNLRGTPSYCMRAESLRADLAWVIHKARIDANQVAPETARQPRATT